MCNCVSDIKKKFTDLLLKEIPGASITECIGFENESIIIPDGDLRLFGHLTGRYVDGKRRRKFEQKLLYNFCPFCGERYVKE